MDKKQLCLGYVRCTNISTAEQFVVVMDKISLSHIYLPVVGDKFILFHCMLDMSLNLYSTCTYRNIEFSDSLSLLLGFKYVLAIVAFYMDILWSLKLLKQTFWCKVNEYVLNEARISKGQSSSLLYCQK